MTFAHGHIEAVPQVSSADEEACQFNVDPDLRFEDPHLDELFQYWDDKRGDRAMPTRHDINPIELKTHLGRIHLIDIEYAPFRQRFRLIGTKTTEVLGRDMTGWYFDEIYPPGHQHRLNQSFAWIVQNKRPLRHYGNAAHANKPPYAIEVLNLPLSEDGELVNMILAELIIGLPKPQP